MTEGIIMALIAFAAGGILKGAIGAGTPVIVIPIMALYFDVRYAVAVFVIPSLLSNFWQGWQYRAHLLDRPVMLRLAGSAMVGAIVGSVMLAALPVQFLTVILAAITLLYVGFRLARPDWSLPRPLADRLAIWAGLFSGILQGAAGISAPTSITYVSAMRLPREAFIGTISVLFCSMSVTQIPTLVGLGLLTADKALISLIACVPLFAAMPVGAWIARFFGRQTFDRLIMALLVVIALRLVWQALGGG